MDETVKKSIRNGLYALCAVWVISFVYGGIYTEIIGEGIGFSINNIFFAAIGAIIAGVPFFLLMFIGSLIFYYFKTKKNK